MHEQTSAPPLSAHAAGIFAQELGPQASAELS
jgi:hypothetical protein